jgi:hypothetical protein
MYCSFTIFHKFIDKENNLEISFHINGQMHLAFHLKCWYRKILSWIPRGARTQELLCWRKLAVIYAKLKTLHIMHSFNLYCVICAEQIQKFVNCGSFEVSFPCECNRFKLFQDLLEESIN